MLTVPMKRNTVLLTIMFAVTWIWGGQRISNSTSVSNVRIFAGILSSSRNFENRLAVRETWGRHPSIAKLMFVVGRPRSAGTMRLLRQEAANRKDVVIMYEVMESYRNVTFQTLEIYKIAYVVGGFTHVLKADDDSYVRMDQLVARLSSLPTTWMYMGRHMIAGDKFDRNPHSHKYVDPFWDDTRHQLPRYAFGSGYVLTADLASAIAFIPHIIMPNQLLNLEDVSTGIWIDHLKQENVHVNYIVENRINGFACNDFDLISHGLKHPGQLRCLHKTGRCCN